MKKYLKLFLNKIGLYTKNQTQTKKNYFNFLNGVLFSLIERKQKINIVQVGANDGVHGDPLYDFIKKYYQRTNLIAIEPQLKAFNELKKNYQSVNNVSFFNGCVGDGNEHIFYSLNDNFKVLTGKKDIKFDGVSSLMKENLVKRLSLYNIDNFDKYIDKTKIRSHLLSNIIESFNYDPKEIDLLQIDAEGYDDQIIYNSEIKVNKFKFINYEYKNLNEEKIKKLHEYLYNSGYEILRWSKSDEIAIRQ